MRTGAASAVGAIRHNENEVIMITGGLWRYVDWRHVVTGCNALVIITVGSVVVSSGGVKLRTWNLDKDKSARRVASPSRRTCCKQIRWMLSVIKLHLPTSISSAILAWSSKLMVDYDSMGPTAFRSQISEFFLQLVVTWLRLRSSRNVEITRIHCRFGWGFG